MLHRIMLIASNVEIKEKAGCSLESKKETPKGAVHTSTWTVLF